MSRTQALWALAHDWALSVDQGTNGKWYVWVWDSSTAAHIKFADYAKLRAWAGY